VVVVGDGIWGRGNGESFLIGGFLAPRLFENRRACVRDFTRGERASERRRIRGSRAGPKKSYAEGAESER
jgi:hypothetical protein